MLPLVQRPTLRRFEVNRDLAVLLLAVILCAIPFLSQPFHMDDNFYMDMARNAQEKPLYPNDTSYVFEGRFLPDMGSHSHPPLITYFLALVQKVAGNGTGREWIFHLCALVFPLLAVLSFYFLSARFVERPIWPSILLAFCPLFMVLQHSLMTDVPTLAFWIAAIASFIWAADLESCALHGVSTVFQFAAMFTSYQSLALTPLLGFYQWRKRGRLSGWISLSVPPAIMVFWFGLGYFHYRRFLLIDTVGYVQSRHAGGLSALATKFLAIIQYQGWLVIFPLFFLYTFGRGLRWRYAALTCLAMSYLAQLAIPGYKIPEKAIFVVGMATGAIVIIRMALFLASTLDMRKAESGFDRIDRQFLGLWYFGVLSYCLFLFTEGSARYILPLVPPLLIFFFRFLELAETAEYRLSARPLMNTAMVASGSVVLSLVWGLGLSHADLEFARIYPRAARECARIMGGMNGYFGGEWGFRYYFKQAGFRQLPMDESSVSGGSWIALPKLALPYDVPAALSTMSMPDYAHPLSYIPATPIRLLDRRTHAGFYSTGWGLLPFSLSRGNLESLELRQVNYLVERLPWARIESQAQFPPWPGYIEIQEKSLLSLLTRNRTRIRYSWASDVALNLRLLLGVAPESYRDRPNQSCHFNVRQLDNKGIELSGYAKMLRPGVSAEDRAWQLVQIPLRPHSAGAEFLELEFHAEPQGNQAIGAFAEAWLAPPGDRN